MKKTILKYMFIAAMAGTAVYACNTPEADGPADGTTVVRSAKAELGSILYGSVKQTRAVNESDPTLTPASDRTSHKLTITIGDESGVYSYSSGSWAITGAGVKFPDNTAADVKLTLAPMVEDPVNAQDGQIGKLIDADILAGELKEQTPVNELPSVTLTHANALLDFEIAGLSATDLSTTTVKINDVIIPYRASASSTKLQAIVKPGVRTATIFIGIGSDKFSAFISPAEGNLQPNTRYTFKVVLEVQGIRIENVAVSQWDEKDPGSGTVVEVLP